jgi:hypothetical protein
MRIIEDGLIVDDHYLPPGTAVGVSIYTTHRDKEVWGSNHDGKLDIGQGQTKPFDHMQITPLKDGFSQ